MIWPKNNKTYFMKYLYQEYCNDSVIMKSNWFCSDTLFCSVHRALYHSCMAEVKGHQFNFNRWYFQCISTHGLFRTVSRVAKQHDIFTYHGWKVAGHTLFICLSTAWNSILGVLGSPPHIISQWGLGRMVTILLSTFSKSLFRMKTIAFQFHWIVFTSFQFTIRQYWFR